MKLRITYQLVVVSALAALVACGGGGDSPPSTGTLQLKITDGPFPDDCVFQAMVTFDGVEARTESGWIDIPLADPTEDGTVQMDLLELTNALDDRLALGEVPVGMIDEIRLHLTESKLVFEDATEQTFKVPSGMASGLKLKIDPPIPVVPGEVTSLVIDVNAAESFHATGVGGDPTCEELKSGTAGAMFSPVLRVLNEDERGILKGTASDGTGTVPHEDLKILVFAQGDYAADPAAAEAVVMTFSATGGGTLAAGAYAVLLDPGTYDIYVDFTPTDETDALTEGALGVVVATGQVVIQDLALDAPAAPAVPAGP